MKNKCLILILFIASITILILCPDAADKSPAEGHLPSVENNDTSDFVPTVPSIETPKPLPLYNYYTIVKNDPGFDLSMHVLEIDPSNPKLEVRPVSSHKTLFGYAFLSEMNEKWDARASVNGGFSHTNGLLGGMYAIDGELLVPATGLYPVLFKKGEKFLFKDATTRVWIDGSVKLDSFHYNQYPKTGGLYVFTPSYGSQNRIRQPHLNAIVSSGEVQGLVMSYDSYDIPKDGFLISAIDEYSQKRLSVIEPGMNLKILYETIEGKEPVDDFDWAYECGSWILRDGEVVAPDKDNWVGSLNIRTPRTAVGIKDDGKLVFVVADGRQKGLSDGLTGKELARELLELNVNNAAFLDGGASSEMIVEGRIVNSPSAGRERMIAAAFIIREKSQ
ncbi:MAG: phosphodiester glycosidase family protein [Clostridiaceae bacterium]|nr:phosphodiester glycosidase family protein [Clostridiaceae bacterium]